MARKKAELPTLSVKIFSPSKIYFEDRAQAVSAVNETGVFDILPLHHNFITLLMPGEVSVKTIQNDVIKIPIEQSLLHAEQDHITIFLDV